MSRSGNNFHCVLIEENGSGKRNTKIAIARTSVLCCGVSCSSVRRTVAEVLQTAKSTFYHLVDTDMKETGNRRAILSFSVHGESI